MCFGHGGLFTSSVQRLYNEPGSQKETEPWVSSPCASVTLCAKLVLA